MSQLRVAKLVDVSVCIGCKACEVACQEWNGLPPLAAGGVGVTGSYQTAPDLDWNLWQLIQFNEISQGSQLTWTMTKYQCMHCADPGCLAVCPAPGAIVQHANGIVDIKQEHCIGCRYCMTGCPFDVPRISPSTGKAYKCSLCVDRVDGGKRPACVQACPTGTLSFGTEADMRTLAQQRLDGLKAHGHAQAALYSPPEVGGTQVLYVLPKGDSPESYGLPKAPSMAFAKRFRGLTAKLSGTALAGGLAGLALHFVAFRRALAAKQAPAAGADDVPVLRYTGLERWIHWTVALTFLYLTLSGLGLCFEPLSGLLRLVGGAQNARALHPAVGLAFSGALAAMVAGWWRDMLLRPHDKAWLRELGAYVRGKGVAGSGRFNAGQKLFFFSQGAAALLALVSGLGMWFPERLALGTRAAAFLLHDLSATVAIGGLFLHVYMGLVVVQGSLAAMLGGKVSRAWAKLHHPLWLEALLGGRSSSERDR